MELENERLTYLISFVIVSNRKVRKRIWWVYVEGRERNWGRKISKKKIRNRKNEITIRFVRWIIKEKGSGSGIDRWRNG